MEEIKNITPYYYASRSGGSGGIPPFEKILMVD